MNERETTARTLEILRTYRRMTQWRLAELSGINKATISAYERGHMAIGSDRLAALLGGLGLSTRAWETTLRHVQWLNYLTERSESPEQTPNRRRPRPLHRGPRPRSRTSGDRPAEAAGGAVSGRAGGVRSTPADGPR